MNRKTASDKVLTFNFHAAKVMHFRRKTILGVALLAIVVFIMELASLGLYKMTQGEWPSFKRLQEIQIERQRQQLTLQNAVLIPHPYIGHVYNRDIDREEFLSDAFGHKPAPFSVNEFGFLDSGSLIRKKERRKILIGITGGSLAMAFSAKGSDVLRKYLEEIPNLKNREISFVRFALGGFKQPQQLMALTYMLALGGELDVLINIDGFNEVALYEPEQLDRGVNPFFPIRWPFNMILFHPESRKLIADLNSEITRRINAASLIRNTILKHSVTANFVWCLLDQYFEQRVKKQMIAFRAFAPKEKPYEFTGPSYSGRPNQLYSDLVDFWVHSSVQLNRISRANGIEYFHFLQPNQYDLNSKPLNESEKRIAYLPKHPYRRGVELGFPLLRMKGQTLREKGVQFGDLSRLFVNIKETIYIDSCCHINDFGNQLLAEAIAKTLLNKFKTIS